MNLFKNTIRIAPPVEHVLVVDDEACRLRAMFAEGVFDGVMPIYAPDAFQAIARISERPWDVLFLDHDLNTCTPDGREVNGMDVALALVDQPWKPTVVIIHSMNFAGAKRMEALLLDRGIDVVRTPITAFTSWAPPRNP